ncbi:MAG: thymidine phosphorylase [Acidobacteriota bacterium]|nr:thymidine phosphorylase [Acidobacteriota bacterium]
MTQMVNLVPLIEKKKVGRSLTDAEIQAWIDAVVAETVPDYQTAALLMAIRLNGMDFDETLALTNAMADSGDRLSFQGYPVLADKHSTGGIGDKVTLILAPIMAAVGLPVTMLSGRGLGFSGGTIDKFESLEGVSCNQGPGAMQAMLDRFGWANAQATERIAPADRILYALRDVTGTVDSIPLITASILSKKLAGGAGCLCMDVKCGTAAFMQDMESARELAGNLKTIGDMGGMNVRGVITRMEEPLGHAVGNYLELLEARDYLKTCPDRPLMELVFALGEVMLAQGGLTNDPGDARARMRKTIDDGSAMDRLERYLVFCGAQPQAMSRLQADSLDKLPRRAVTAERSGMVHAVKGRDIGYLMVDLGAGRKVRSDAIDPLAGLVLARHVNDRVERGQVIAWLYGEKGLREDPEVDRRIRACFEIGEARDALRQPVVLHAF